eukprot:1794985-Amphidinium_carterae.1
MAPNHLRASVLYGTRKLFTRAKGGALHRGHALTWVHAQYHNFTDCSTALGRNLRSMTHASSVAIGSPMVCRFSKGAAKGESLISYDGRIG